VGRTSFRTLSVQTTIAVDHLGLVGMFGRADPELNRDAATAQATRQGSQTIAATKSVSPEAGCCCQ